jgi:hypothetical protein
MLATLSAAAVSFAPAAAQARSCHVPRYMKTGWPVVVQIDVFGGATCTSGEGVASSLIEQIQFHGAGSHPHEAGGAGDHYRCVWPRRTTAQGDPRHLARCRRVRRQVHVEFGG